MAISRAETLISRTIRGNIVKDSQVRTEIVRLDKPSRILPLEHSPITEVVSVTIDGSSFASYTFTPFCLRTSYDTPWPADTDITVLYLTGWEAGNYPDEINEAIAMTETWLLSKPETGIAEQTIGPFTTRRNESGFKLPESIAILLQPWVRPLW